MTPSEATPFCEPDAGTSTAASWLTARAQVILGACACGGAAAFLFAVDPSRHAVYPTCLLYQMTGIYCAGCGATRAAHALLHGNFLAALHDNALFVGSLPFLAWVALPYLARVWRENRWPEIRLAKCAAVRLAVGVLTGAMAFMVLRNLPGWPFELLRPL